ncbi:hypothetical protein PYCCODRAFT_1433232 [Trametes coccinea BRFM310]|uniref:Uncharacterized protein n=1 Tax=Trametes coccinea (strain BRFM310) TaxID=1353009 RepID=A0A1Y2IUW2_TRAC3|nr:hypothetical protein PYCCODRAFT_1433232 [Trametes coccinea BRFM310]
MYCGRDNSSREIHQRLVANAFVMQHNVHRSKGIIRGRLYVRPSARSCIAAFNVPMRRGITSIASHELIFISQVRRNYKGHSCLFRIDGVTTIVSVYAAAASISAVTCRAKSGRAMTRCDMRSHHVATCTHCLKNPGCAWANESHSGGVLCTRYCETLACIVRRARCVLRSPHTLIRAADSRHIRPALSFAGKRLALQRLARRGLPSSVVTSVDSGRACAVTM